MISELLRNIGRLFQWIIIVAPWEQALRVRLGSRVRLLDAGTYIRIPFIDRVYRQSTRRRLSIIAPQTLTTKDGRTITIGSTIGYEIVDLMKLYKTLHDAVDTIESEVSAVVAGYIAEHDFKECVADQIESHVRSNLKLASYGLGASEFYITNFAAVRTLRLITGEIKTWPRGDHINTTIEDTVQPR